MGRRGRGSGGGGRGRGSGEGKGDWGREEVGGGVGDARLKHTYNTLTTHL